VYKPAFHPGVARDLKGLDESIRRRILDKIHWLPEHVEEMRHEPLTAQWEGTLPAKGGRLPGGVWYRPGTHAVGHRREIYKLR